MILQTGGFAFLSTCEMEVPNSAPDFHKEYAKKIHQVRKAQGLVLQEAGCRITREENAAKNYPTERKK